MEIIIGLLIVGAVLYWIGKQAGRRAAPSAPVVVFEPQATERRPRRRTKRPVARFEIVGEASYQPALEAICGGRTEEEADFPCEVTLVPEPANQYDANAVRVEVSGKLVGYLSRKSAKDYLPIAAALGERRITAPGQIVGGWSRGAGDWGHFGVRVQLPPAGELLADIEAGRR